MAIRFFENADSASPLPFRLQGLGVDHRQEPIRRVHGYSRFQWIQLRSGDAWVETINGMAMARSGDGLFLRPGEYHAYHDARGDGSLVVDWMNFDGSGVELALASGPLGQSGVYRLARPDLVHAWFVNAWAETADAALASRRRLSSLVYRLLMELAEAAAPPGQTTVSDDLLRLLPLIRALEARLAEEWTVGDMAAIVGVSAQHLGRLFARSLGQSPLEYLIGLRINRGRVLLVERPELRVHEVAEASGYGDVNHFIRRFRQREGCTPGEFRSLHRH
jgi:AraC-like DNA-binding protein